MLLVAGWLGHDSNIEAQPPGLYVLHPPGRPVAVAGWRRGADAQGPQPFALFVSLCPREARIRGTCLGPRGTNGAQSQQNEHLGGAQMLGRGAGPHTLSAGCVHSTQSKQSL